MLAAVDALDGLVLRKLLQVVLDAVAPRDPREELLDREVVIEQRDSSSVDCMEAVWWYYRRHRHSHLLNREVVQAGWALRV
jgi:hypothetical protein